jgi:pimeloyl-ACP methyl ester carboxylesterase
MRATVVWPEWISREPYGPKYQRLLGAIRKERQKGREVVIVGISAGAALGLLAFAEGDGDVCSFVSVCGFTQLKPTDVANKELMKLSWFRAANAAELAARALAPSQRKRILSLIARSDRVIDIRQEYIGGATNVRMYSRGHLMSIAVALFWYRRRIKYFVTSKD